MQKTLQVLPIDTYIFHYPSYKDTLKTMTDAQPPDENPILKAYESFTRETPLVTRYLLQMAAITWILSFFLDLELVVGNVPHFTIFKFEVYRILLSPFICTSLLSLVFGYLSFTDYGRRMEQMTGSASFALLLLTMGLAVNILHLVACFILYGLSGANEWLFLPCSGIWILIFGLLSVECSSASSTSMRRLFVVNVPTQYYPLALLGLFTLLGGFQLAYLISIGVGAAYQKGHLDRLKVDNTRIQRWEQTTLESYTSREGWISNEASGRGDWSEPTSFTNGFFSRLMPQQRQQPQQQTGEGSTAAVTVAGDARPGRVIRPGMSATSDAASSFPESGGRQLGTASRRAAPADPRQARLDAIERRLQNNQHTQANNDNNV